MYCMDILNIVLSCYHSLVYFIPQGKKNLTQGRVIVGILIVKNTDPKAYPLHLLSRPQLPRYSQTQADSGSSDWIRKIAQQGAQILLVSNNEWLVSVMSLSVPIILEPKESGALGAVPFYNLKYALGIDSSTNCLIWYGAQVSTVL